MLFEVVKKYRSIDFDLNCSEAILYSAKEYYNLNISDESLKLSAGFGSGIQSESTCGTIIAAVMVIGFMFTKETGHRSPLMMEATNEFVTKFNEKYKSNSCKELKVSYRTKETGCSIFIIEVSKLLEEIINKYQKL